MFLAEVLVSDEYTRPILRAEDGLLQRHIPLITAASRALSSTGMSAISAADAAAAITAGTKVIDVRTPSQHADNGLADSISLPLSRIEEGAVPSGVRQEETFFVVCEFGGFSELAAAYLQALGYPGVRSVRGGLRALRAAESAGQGRQAWKNTSSM